MHIFYTPDIKGEYYTLSEDESKHCIKVLRLKPSDKIILIDGKGGYYDAEIMNELPKACLVKIINAIHEYGKRNFHLHIAVAPTKNNDRLEFFAEKATEIGIDLITPLICHNSERTKLNTERLKKIVISAAKQSFKAYLPIVNEPVKCSNFIKQNHEGFSKFIAHCYDNPKKHLKEIYKPGDNALILIGPEGDFSTEEVKTALDSGFSEVSLSPSRLRTETAAIVGSHTINLLNE
ncbi:MAG: 16S rRNA (uracil(1498)-N(3))-methyltransferase [Bacteroidota bacterium]|nr:16S rRNA (uracil(1498)-N(3))-methyltransferase [Bacteroidota bacterium]